MNTSSDGYETVYEKSGPENDGKYYEGYLEKKEKSKWVHYWCVLKHQNLYFFTNVNTQVKETYVGYCHFEPGLHVEIIKSKKEKYEWVIKTKEGKIVLRTTSVCLRDGWLNSIQMSMKHQKPDMRSHFLPGSGPASPTHLVGPPQSHHSPVQNGQSSPSERKGSLKYQKMSDEQVARLQALEVLQNDPQINLGELQVDLDRLDANNKWYMKSSCRADVEHLLEERVPGTFIVRDFIDNNTKVNKGFVISLKDEKAQFRHHRVERRDAILYLKGYEQKAFQTLRELLEFFIMSQKKKITLVPYDPDRPDPPPQHPSRVSYENTDRNGHQRPLPDLPRPLPPTPTGYTRMDDNPTQRPSLATVGRSLSLQHRRLPETPTQRSGRSVSVRDHHYTPRREAQGRSVSVRDHHYTPRREAQVPTPPQPLSESPPYLQMTQTPPPQFSPASEPTNSYINIAPSHGLPISPPEGIPEIPTPPQPLSESPPYLQMTQTPPPQFWPASEPTNSYINIAPSHGLPISPPEGIPESPYENTGVNVIDDDRPPVLPPKKRSASLPIIPPYVNLPHGNTSVQSPPVVEESYLDMNCDSAASGR